MISRDDRHNRRIKRSAQYRMVRNDPRPKSGFVSFRLGGWADRSARRCCWVSQTFPFGAGWWARGHSTQWTLHNMHIHVRTRRQGSCRVASSIQKRSASSPPPPLSSLHKTSLLVVLEGSNSLAQHGWRCCPHIRMRASQQVPTTIGTLKTQPKTGVHSRSDPAE